MSEKASITCPKCGQTSYHPKDIAEGYCGACHDWTSIPTGVKQLAPGLWIGKDNVGHWNIPEFLKHCEIEDTPENRAMVSELCKELMRQQIPGMGIVQREKPD